MEFRPVKINNSLLTEGETYPFTILNKMELGRGEEYFVLRDPLGYKMLMPAGFYQHYQFQEGQDVFCRVDKINCNGRMFLEPRSPWYAEGQVYEFPVICRGQRKNIAGLVEYYFLVEDASERKCRVRRPASKNYNGFPEKVSCLVERIKKGQLYLRLHGAEPEQTLLSQGESYQFTVLKEKMNPDDGSSYYIVEDPFGGRHLLRKKYFVQYRLRKGTQFMGRIDGTFGDGYLFIEPNHPDYDVGSEYVFDVNRLVEYVFSNGTRQKVIVLKDCFDEDIKVRLDEVAARRWAPYKKLRCRVFKIRKSRVDVEILAPA